MDPTSFFGSVVLTDTFEVPGSPTALLVAIGLLGLAWSRRRSA